MGSIAGGVGTSWLWPWHIHPHQKRQTNTRSLLYTRKLLVFLFPFFLTIERPVLVMVCLYRHWGKNGGHIAFIKHAEFRKRLHRASTAPGQFNSIEGNFVRVMAILIKYLWRCSSSEDTKVAVMFCGADAMSQHPKRTTVLSYICILFSCLWRTASVRIDTGAVEKAFGHLCNKQ